MDSISITTGCMSLFTNINKTINAISAFVKDFGGARPELDTTKQELGTLEGLVKQILDDCKKFNLDEDSQFPEAIRNLLINSLKKSKSIVQDLNDLIDNDESSKISTSTWWTNTGKDSAQKLGFALEVQQERLSISHEYIKVSTTHNIRVDPKGSKEENHQGTAKELFEEIAPLKSRIPSRQGPDNSVDDGREVRLRQYLEKILEYAESVGPESDNAHTSLEREFVAFSNQGEDQSGHGEDINEASFGPSSWSAIGNGKTQNQAYDVPIPASPTSNAPMSRFQSQVLSNPLTSLNRYKERRGSNASGESTAKLLSNVSGDPRSSEQFDVRDGVLSSSSSNYSRPASAAGSRDEEDSTILASDQLWAAPITAAPRIQLFVGRDKAFTNLFGKLTTINIGETFESPNDTILKGGDTKKVKIWGVSPDGKHLAAIKRGMLDRLWVINVATGKSKFKWFFESGGYSGKAIFSPDSRYLVAMNAYKKLQLWDMKTGRSIRTVRGVQRCYKIAISSDCLCLFVGFESGEIQVWDLHTLKRKFSILSSKSGLENRILQFAASANEMKIAYVTADGRVGIYDVEEKTIQEWEIPGPFLTRDDAMKIRYSNHPRDEHIAISDDGTFLSLLHFNSLFVWETSTRQLLLRHENYITAQVTGSNKLLTLTRDEDPNLTTNWLLTMHSLG